MKMKKKNKIISIKITKEIRVQMQIKIMKRMKIKKEEGKNNKDKR